MQLSIPVMLKTRSRLKTVVHVMNKFLMTQYVREKKKKGELGDEEMRQIATSARLSSAKTHVSLRDLLRGQMLSDEILDKDLLEREEKKTITEVLGGGSGEDCLLPPHNNTDKLSKKQMCSEQILEREEKKPEERQQ